VRLQEQIGGIGITDSDISALLAFAPGIEKVELDVDAELHGPLHDLVGAGEKVEVHALEVIVEGQDAQLEDYAVESLVCDVLQIGVDQGEVFGFGHAFGDAGVFRSSVKGIVKIDIFASDPVEGGAVLEAKFVRVVRIDADVAVQFAVLF